MRVLLLVLLAGCAGRAEPVEIVVPAGASAAVPVDAFRAPRRLPDCPQGHVAVAAACEPAETAYAAAGGRTFVVDGARGRDDADGSAAHPWRTISRSTGPDVLRPGDAVLVRQGVYRETVAPREGGSGPDARVTFAAYPGEAVVISGADPADDGWTVAGPGLWRRPWAGPDLPAYGGDDWHFRRPLLVAAGRVLRPVESVRDLTPGTFTTEGSDDRPTALLARFAGDASPRAAGPVEIAVRTYGIRPEGADPYADCGSEGTPGWLRLVGFTVRHTANRAQWGAVCAGSRGGLVEDVAAEWTNGAGVDGSGRGHTFRRVRADHNGQIGWVARCTDCLFEDSQAVGNNWKGHDPFWEAGGGKWNRTTGTTIRRHYAADNDGPGVWLDGDNADNTVEGCRLVGNQAAGVMLELRTVRTLVQHTHVEGTRWLEWTGTGILSQAASGNVIVHNTVVGNEGTGVWLRLDPARRAPDGGTVVANNWIAGNAALASVEAREVSVEAESAAALRSTQFEGNVYGTVRGDPVLRSRFYASPFGSSGLRSNALAEWQAVIRGDERAALALPARAGRRAAAVPVRAAGAAAAPFVRTRLVGARPDLVRAAL